MLKKCVLLLLDCVAVTASAQGDGYVESDSLSASVVIPADKVTRDRINKGLLTNPLDALSGQAAGVNVSKVGGNDPLVIIDERLFELMWEGWRRQDLVRYGLFSKSYDQQEQLQDEENNYTSVFPISASSLSLNKSLKQNYGYE